MSLNLFCPKNSRTTISFQQPNLRSGRAHLRAGRGIACGFAACLLAVCLLAGAGCDRKTPLASAGTASPATAQEQLVTKAFKVQEDALNLLSNIRDQQSAEAAFAGLENIRAEIERLIAEAKRSGELTPESKARILAEVQRRKQEITQKVTQFTGQLASNPQLLKSLQPLLQKLDEVRQQIDGFIN